MTNKEKTEISTLKFDEEYLEIKAEEENSKNWPVVYVLQGKSEAYVGETTNFIRRMKEHLSNEKRKNLSDIYLIYNEKFNKSATLDIESMLIEHIAAENKYELQNSNRGLRNHDYYERKYYIEEFENIWESLRSMDFSEKTLQEIRNSELFKMSPFKTLTDEQYMIADTIEKFVQTKAESKHIIHGEPGTGKTILAVYLMKFLLDEFPDKKIGLVIPMTSLRKTIKKVFKTVKGLKGNMVIGPYDAVKGDIYDVLIVDEAHRLTKRKNLSNYKAFDVVNEQLGLETKSANQLDWIRKSSKHMVLFYDRNQTVKPADIDGSKFSGMGANMYTLESQFRVKSSINYTKYIENILKQRNTEKKDVGDYDFKIFEDVDAMVQAIKTKDKEIGLCRNVAGYCWPWISKKDKNLYDIEIGDYKYRWNTTNIDWINSEDAINEIGCIHTTQGYDLNYCGVIIGEDLVFRDGKVQYNPDGYKDVSAKDLTLTSEQMRDYIVNIYKVLMTRGILGTYVYVCDEQLRKYIERYIEKHI